MPNKPAPNKKPGTSRPSAGMMPTMPANKVKPVKPGMLARPSAVKKFLKKYSQGMQ